MWGRVLSLMFMVGSVLAGCAPGAEEADRSHASPASTAPANVPRLSGLPRPLWIAHRGGMGEYPESSARAYNAAARSGFALEVDLRVLEDNTLVIHHDESVERTTDGSGRVDSFDRPSWALLRIDDGGGAPLTWEAFLDEHSETDLIVAEVKSADSLQPFIDSVTERGVAQRIMAQSFRRADVEATAAAGIPSMLLVQHADPAVPDRVAYVGCQASTATLKRCVEAAKAQRREFAVWTINDKGSADQAIHDGAFAVFTNAPWKLSGRRPR